VVPGLWWSPAAVGGRGARCRSLRTACRRRCAVPANAHAALPGSCLGGKLGSRRWEAAAGRRRGVLLATRAARRLRRSPLQAQCRGWTA
jgi:hypothetical protein